MSIKTSIRRRTSRQTLTRNAQKAKAESMREWVQSCADAAEKRVKAAREARDERRTAAVADAALKGDRLLARVWAPVHDYPVEQHPVTGRWVRQPYRNPARAAKLAKSGRLRAELREDVSA